MHFCEIWGNTYITNLNGITILPKKVIRIICGKPRLEHTNPLFYEMKMLKFIDIIEYLTAIIIYKAYHTMLPYNIQSMFQYSTKIAYNTRQKHVFKEKYARTTLKSMCVSIIGVKRWNKMNSKIIYTKSIHLFKNNYKNFILNKYNTINT